MRPLSPPNDESRSTATWLWLALGVGLLVFLLGSGWLYSRLQDQEEERAVSLWTARLEAVADARKRAIQNWLNERRTDAEVHAWDSVMVRICSTGVCPKGAQLEEIQAELENWSLFSGFRGAYLFTPQGGMLLMAESGEPPCEMAGPMARRVAREGRYLLHSMHRGDRGEPLIGFLAPVFMRADPAVRPEGAPVLGVIGHYLDPRDTLFPLLDRADFRPATAEILLVERDGSEALVMGSEALGGGTALGERLPVSGAVVAETIVFDRGETSGRLVDRNGRAVLAAVRWIPEAGWAVVAKVDADDALADWRQRARLEAAALLAVFLCFALGGLAAWRTWAGHRYRLLLEGLRDREERLRALAFGSDDLIFIKDVGGRYLLANPATAHLLGTTPQGALGRHAADFLPRERVAVIDAHEREVIEGGTAFHGEEILPLEGEDRVFLSARIPIRDAQGNVAGVAGVLRDITGRKRDEEALARWARTLGGLYRLAGSLTLARDEREVLRTSLAGAVDAFQADVATLYVLAPGGAELVLVEASGVPQSVRERFGSIPIGHGVTGKVFRQGALVTLADYRADPDGIPEAAALTGVVSLAAVPLRAEGQILGAMTLGYRLQRAFGSDENSALETVGHMAGVALERARAAAALAQEVESRRRAEERLRRLHDATASWTGGRLFDQVALALSREIGARFCMVNRIDLETQRGTPLAAVVGGEPIELESFPLQQTPCGEVVETGEPVHYRCGIRARFPAESLPHQLGIDSYFGMPLWDSRQELVGVLCALSDGPLEVGPAEKDLMGLYARRAAGEVERLLAAERLTETRRTLETLIENLPGGVYRSSFESKRSVAYVSRGIEAVLGSSLTVGSMLEDAIVAEDRGRVWREIQAACRGGGRYEVEYRVQDADGSIKWVCDVGRAVPGEQGTATLEGVLFDYTERRSLEAQLTHSQRMEALGRLAGGVAHDFNNLLTAISGYAEMLVMRIPEGDRAHRSAKEIVRAADRAADLTRQLLAFSRRQVVDPKVIGLNDTVQGLTGMLQRLLGEDVVFEAALAPGAGEVRADPVQLEQVLLNLVVNARDAMPNGGRLTIRTTAVVSPGGGDGGTGQGEPERFAVVEVTDTGVGIGPEVLPYIFEPFFTTKEEGKGTGLGLATVYGVVKQAGGFVRVTSAAGQGTSFQVHWPQVAGGREEARTEAEVLLEGGRGERIVLVEDEDSVRRMVAEHLAASGYQVEQYRSGEEALGGLSSLPGLDVLVTDVVMPGLSGPELARKFQERWQGLPVIFISGHTGDTAIHLGAEGPETWFLQKPFRLGDLESVVRAALGREPH